MKSLKNNHLWKITIKENNSIYESWDYLKEISKNIHKTKNPFEKTEIFAVFNDKKTKTMWWKDQDGNILAEWFKRCWIFKEEIAFFDTKDTNETWIITNEWKQTILKNCAFNRQISEWKIPYLSTEWENNWWFLQKDWTEWKGWFLKVGDFDKWECWVKTKDKKTYILNHIWEQLECPEHLIEMITENIIYDWWSKGEYINIIYYLHFNKEIRSLVASLWKTDEEIAEYQRQYFLHRHELYPDKYPQKISATEYVKECAIYNILYKDLKN